MRPDGVDPGGIGPGPRPLRVLWLATEAHGAGGGIAQYNRDFAAALARLPDVAAIDLLARRGAAAGEALPARLRPHRPRRRRIAYAAAALGLALRRRPDLVICGHLFMAVLAALLARLCGARLVVQLHGIEVWRPPGPLRRRALEAADLVLCVSRDTRARLLSACRLAPERAVVLPNTVAEAFAPGERSTQGPARGPVVLLSVGRLDAREAYKGHDTVIACLPDLARRGHDVVYRIAGAGTDRPRLERLAREAGVADRVAFLGLVPQDALPDLYRQADLFVLPSRGEGFGIVFLEAMACGTPALGLALGGAVDALEGLGRAVAPEAFAEALADEVARARRSGGEERRALARRVRARFGRPVFEAGVARAIGRLAGASPAPARGRAPA